MGISTALIGLVVSLSLLNCFNNLNNSVTFSSSVKEKNMFDAAPPFSLGNQLLVYINGAALLYPSMSDSLKLSTPACLKSLKTWLLYSSTVVTMIIFILLALEH